MPTPTVTKELDKYEPAVSADTCPLLAFTETWSARRDRYKKASTRLDWLSIPRNSKIRMSEFVLRPASQSVPGENFESVPPQSGGACDGGPCGPATARRPELKLDQKPEPKAEQKPQPKPELKPILITPEKPAQKPATAGQKLDDSSLSVDEIKIVQRALCVPVTGTLGESTSKTCQAIVEYQAATNQAKTGKVDTTTQRDELLGATPCVLQQDPRSAFQQFYLAKPEQKQKFYADLQSAMTYLSTKPGKVNKVSVSPELTARTLAGAADEVAQTRLAIEVIEESLARAKRGFLNQQVLDAIRDYKSKANPSGSPANTGSSGTGDRQGSTGTPIPVPVALTAWEAQLKPDDVEKLQL
jgi:hypothetical protein